MKLDIKQLDNLVEEGYLRRSDEDGLSQYTYTDKCTYEKKWNEYTRICRGVIVERSSNEIIALPFPKFFNLGEMPETSIDNLPEEYYSTTEKVDGSLGIIYCYKHIWRVATKGSFNSEQALKATEMLSKYNVRGGGIVPWVTLLVEIVYPENKIVVDYGKKEGLVLLGAFEVMGGKEISDEGLVLMSKISGIPLVNKMELTIEKMIELQKTLPKDKEGFVVKFENGLRVKIKGDEYMKIHKMLSNLSPISFWEGMDRGRVNREYLMQLPEEYRPEYEPIVAELEKQYDDINNEVFKDLLKMTLDIGAPPPEITREYRKKIGLYLGSHKLKHSSAMFPIVLKNTDALDKYILKLIRPTGNVIKEL